MIKFLYTNIGRGHPFYLDGIVERLKQDSRLKYECHDVFEISKDPALLAWRMARWFYQIGSTDSIIGRWYNSIRDKSDYNKYGLTMRIMGQDLRKLFLSDDTPLVVDHPVLVGILRGKKNLIYQHGEIAVPPQAVVRGADYVFVPLESSAVPFIRSGYNQNQLIVTGLCIEPELVNQFESSFETRLKRINGNGSLTGAFFSSGAEPKSHVRKLQEAVESIVCSEYKAIVFAAKGGKVYNGLKRLVKEFPSNLSLCTYESRAELDSQTDEHFNKFDYFVAPSHERTSWALGLGLPMFILEPPIGPFAPLNREVLHNAGVAISLDSRTVSEFCWALPYYRTSGRLAEMAESGWKRHPINGFQVISDFLINKYAPSA